MTTAGRTASVPCGSVISSMWAPARSVAIAVASARVSATVIAGFLGIGLADRESSA